MKKIILLAITALILAGCSTNTEQAPESDQDNEKTSLPAMTLKDLGPAPELYNETWLNTDQPLRLADLRGKVILLDMWTFG